MKKTLLAIALCTALFSCKKNTNEEPQIDPSFVNEDPSTFAEVGMIDIGDVGAAEITAFDPATKRLFVVNNGTVNKIDVIDFADPTKMTVVGSISMAPYGGAVNSVAVSNGKIAAAIESLDKQANGKVAVFNTNDLKEVRVIAVGALPDMITYSPDGKYILTANEGEPNDTYTNDPAGTVSIITVDNNYAVSTIDLSSMSGQKTALMAAGFRVFGIGNDFVKDIEPEYVTISEDSKTAWVTLQENNGIAKIDIASKTITNIFPLGFKDYNVTGNEIDPSDRDNGVGLLGKWPVKGIYMPDGIAVFEKNGVPYLFTANEGDAREYSALTEVSRVKDLRLDAAAFPTGTALKTDAQLGRLNVTTTLGDTDGDGDYDALYSLGSRSFSVWNGLNGKQVFDSQNDLDLKALATGPGIFDDGRSDDKSIEPEGIALGKVGHKMIAAVGMERADAVAIYDVTDPARPVFLQLFKCGDAPEGILIIPAKDSPTKKSLLVISSENDGLVKVYTPRSK